MRIWADVYDASGNRLGEGPVLTVSGATISRALDGAGTFSLRAAGTDARALTLLTNERRVKLWGEDTGGVRLLGEGIIRKVNMEESQTGVTRRAGGPDVLDELKRRNTLRGRIYNQQTVATVAAGLIALAPGWSVDVDAGIAADLVDARYDGASVLKAFQDMAGRYGYHLRASATASKTLELGAFGDSNGLRIHKIEQVTQEALSNPDLLMVQTIDTEDDSKDVVNWIEPLGAGEGVAALTLEHSTRTTPYTIQTTTGPDGTTVYYLKDATSITAYGEIQKIAQFKGVSALTNTDTDIENAANALYDAAVEYLERYKDIQEAYRVTVKNAKTNVLPGDKIHIDYKAQVQMGGTFVDYLNVQGDFWVLKATERVGLEESAVDLEVSNIDRARKTTATAVADSVESIEMRNLKPQITSSARSYVYDREISSGYSAIVPVEFTDATLSLQRARLRLKTTPFRATASSAASGGGGTETSVGGTAHKHYFLQDGGPTTPDSPHRHYLDYYGVVVEIRSEGAGNLSTFPDGEVHTHDIDLPNHTHPISFGITDDSQTPIDVTVEVNGVGKTLELFGSSTLAPAGGNLNVVADMDVLTNLILNATGGLRQAHDIEIKCGGGRGRVEVTVEVFEVTQAIKI